MSNLKINIYSLKGSLVQEEADLVEVPGFNGDIGVITGDRVLTYILKPGIIYLIKNETVFKRYFIFNGRFIAYNNDLTITTEYEVLDLDKITKAEIELRIANITNKVNNAHNFEDKEYYEMRLQQENLLLSSYKDKFY